ncbi:energy-coupling factor transporter ATPase [Desmospora profundinema]|uniref:Energy-coupling factor transport system ATP-binding protein n=1 Tax=Desmospora profundinema TaxID=1571184 RepID=A0ABU1IQV8_9BACL|nr:energy-coupling factor transporter ATPase [Desmospora profundinema]MDR6226927.1 energy-coupling factor transport system ATP-binding protein [Desmospora profundinema]
MIQLENVTFHYPGRGEEPPVSVLSGVDWCVRQGEYVAVMGPNGSGKSTMAKLFNALLLPDEGTVRVCGMDTRDEKLWGVIRQRVGMVFQNPDNQIVGTTVRDDVAFGLENLGLPREEMRRRIADVLPRVGLSGMEEQSPHHLSGGQKQRLAIAGVIAMRPDVIVFDEATSMLDPEGRQEVLDTIRSLHEEGTTVIHITHSAGEALCADRIAVMAAGSVRMDGPPREIFRQGDRLREWSLEMPLFAEVADRLRREGVPLSRNISSEEALVRELWALL